MGLESMDTLDITLCHMGTLGCCLDASKAALWAALGLQEGESASLIFLTAEK